MDWKARTAVCAAASRGLRAEVVAVVGSATRDAVYAFGDELEACAGAPEQPRLSSCGEPGGCVSAR